MRRLSPRLLFTHTASSVSQLQKAGGTKESFRRLSGYGD